MDRARMWMAKALETGSDLAKGELEKIDALMSSS